MGPTWPNRLYWMTGMIDPEGASGGPVIENKVPAEGYRWKTYAERLEEAGIDWRVYTHLEGDHGFNMLANFSRFMDAAPGSALKRKGVPAAVDGQFEYDALHDRLPAVSWVCPSAEASEHPTHMPAAGAEFIAGKLDAIASTMMKTMGCSTMLRRPYRLRARRGNLSTACLSGPAFAFPASSYRHGRPVAGFAAGHSITPRSCNFWNSSPACGKTISATGGERHLAI
jgi:hypothetical protein